MIIPRKRPEISRARAGSILLSKGVDLTKPAILAMRGYFQDTMGKPGVNDRGIYDDAIIVVTPSKFMAFNGNTDPSASYKYGVAMLVPGVYPYRLGWHKKGQPSGHPALRPATKDEELPVTRDGVRDPAPGVAINIHRGSRTSTSSLGCQTLHPDQWDEFYNLVQRVMSDAKQTTIPYCLVELQG